MNMLLAEPCQGCLRWTVCVCEDNVNVPCSLREQHPNLLLAAVVVYVQLRVLGWAPPILEMVAVMCLMLDAAPLRRDGFVLEASCWALILKCIPWLGWRAGIVCGIALMTVQVLRLVRVAPCTISLDVVDLITMLSISATAWLHLPLDDGSGVTSLISWLFVTSSVLFLIELQTSVSTPRPIKYMRGVLLAAVGHAGVVSSGLIFALTTCGSSTPEDALLEEEFAAVPQHMSVIMLCASLTLLYTIANIPVNLIVATIVVVHVVVTAVDPSTSAWITLRVRYNMESVVEWLICQPARFVFSMKRDERRLHSLLTAVVAIALWFIASVLWSMILGHNAVLMGVVSFGLQSWAIVASLSNKQLSIGFAFMVTMTPALMFAITSVFSEEHLKQSFVSIAASGPPLLLACIVLWCSNQSLFYRENGPSSAKRTGGHPHPKGPPTRPRRKR